jgi:hypothetical protein
LEAAVGETANDDEFEPDGSEDQALHRPDRIVYTRPPLEEEAAALRNTLRLSQIALLDTGLGDDDDAADGDVDSLDKPVQFRHDTASKTDAADSVVDEAPMAEDVKSTLTAAEIHVFNSPDDEIERIAARLNGEPMPEPAPKQPEDISSEFQVAEDPVAKTTDSERDVTSQDESDDLLELRQEDSEAAFEADLEDAVNSANEASPKTSSMSDAFQETLDAMDEAQESDVPVESALELSPEDTETELQSVETDAQETALAEEAISAAVLDVLDEDDLRPIVARMIREELQGELGERITRNVRKLVRREILRALAARDAE